MTPADQPPSPVRPNGGIVLLIVTVIGAVLACIPATTPFGGLLCLFLIVPAIVLYVRARRARAARDVRPPLAALVVAPVFFVVALAVGPSTSADTTAKTTPLPAPASTPAVVQPVQVNPAPSEPVQAPALVQPSLAPDVVAPAPRGPVAVPSPAQTPPPAPPPVAEPVYPLAPDYTSTCDEDTHYVNSNGRCVLRPTHAASPPVGASAVCQDGTYSSSQHRKGTCSHHGGVAEWR